MSGGSEGRAEAARPGLGHALLRARKERGFSLEEAERAAKIRKDFLARLEQEDYDGLPEPVYVRGFLKAYGDFLGLDGVTLATQLEPQKERRSHTRWERLWDR